MYVVTNSANGKTPKGRTSFTIDPNILAQARRFAASRGISLSSIIEDALLRITSEEVSNANEG